MDVSAKGLSPSPEEAAFRYCYHNLLYCVHNPIQFAEFLIQEGVIDSDTKNRITSDEDDDPKRVLLDCLQKVLSKSEIKRPLLLKIRTAMEKSGGNTWCLDRMDEFIDGEYTTVANLKSKPKTSFGQVIATVFLSQGTTTLALNHAWGGCCPINVWNYLLKFGNFVCCPVVLAGFSLTIFVLHRMGF